MKKEEPPFHSFSFIFIICCARHQRHWWFPSRIQGATNSVEPAVPWLTWSNFDETWAPSVAERPRTHVMSAWSGQQELVSMNPPMDL